MEITTSDMIKSSSVRENNKCNGDRYLCTLPSTPPSAWRHKQVWLSAAQSVNLALLLAVPQMPPTATARNATQTRVALENLKYSKCFSHFEVHNWLTRRENNTWACQNSVISPSTAALSEINLRAAKCFLPLSPARNVHAHERGISYQPTTIISRPNKVFS